MGCAEPNKSVHLTTTALIIPKNKTFCQVKVAIFCDISVSVRFLSDVAGGKILPPDSDLPDVAGVKILTPDSDLPDVASVKILTDVASCKILHDVAMCTIVHIDSDLPDVVGTTIVDPFIEFY